MDVLAVVAFGFFLGMRHATDADHVVAVTTIVTRQKDLLSAAMTGLLWGAGHSLTVILVGTLIILFNLTIPERVGLGMELSVGVMLVVLGVMNIASCLRFRPSIWRRLAGSAGHVHSHAHSHGDYVHSHPHGHEPDVHPHSADQTPVAALDRRFGRWRVYRYTRPVVIGIVHGLAGSASVALLVVAAVRQPRWAVAYLLFFGVGTIAGMMLVTVSIASAVRLAGGRSERISRGFGFAAGLASVVFGLVFAYQVWSSANLPQSF
jgi:high-affinity nickel-transport protein